GASRRAPAPKPASGSSRSSRRRPRQANDRAPFRQRHGANFAHSIVSPAGGGPQSGKGAGSGSPDTKSVVRIEIPSEMSTRPSPFASAAASHVGAAPEIKT